jgi:hypothetical protein
MAMDPSRFALDQDKPLPACASDRAFTQSWLDLNGDWNYASSVPQVWPTLRKSVFRA